MSEKAEKTPEDTFKGETCKNDCGREPCIRIATEEGVIFLCRVCLDRQLLEE